MPPKKPKPQKVDLGALFAEPAKAAPKATAPAPSPIVPKAAAAKTGGFAPKARAKAPAAVPPKAAEKKVDLDAQAEALIAEAEAAAAPTEDAECSNAAQEKAAKEVGREAAKVRRAEEKAAKEASKAKAKEAVVVAVETAVSGTGEVAHVAEQADELIVKVQPSEFRKPGYVMIKGNPCKISDVIQMKLSTNGGNRKLHIIGVDVFTGKKYEDIINTTAGFHGIDIPVTKKAMYTVIDVDESSGFLSLLTTEGGTKDDASLCKDEAGDWDAIAAEVVREFQGGRDLQVTVLTIMGKDIVIDIAIG